MHEMLRMGLAAVSPDGKKAVFSATQWTSADDVFTSNLFAVDLEEPYNVKMITDPGHGHADSAPVFASTSQTVAFIRDGQIYKVSLSDANANADPIQVSDFPVPVHNLHWSADGSKFAFTAAVYPGMDLDATAAEQARRAALKTTGQMYTDTFVRHWDVWFADEWTHVFYAEYTGKLLKGPDAKDVMPSFDGHCPPQPFGDRSQFGFSNSANEIAITVMDGRDKAWRTNANVHLVALDDISNPKCLTCSNPGRDAFSGFSADDSTIAMLSNRVPGYESDRNRLTMWDRSTGAVRWITDAWDLSVSSAQFVDESTTKMLATVEYLGKISLFSIDGATGAHAQIKIGLSEGSILSVIPAGSGTGTYVLGVSSFERPKELFIYDSGANTTVRMTHLSDKALADKEMVKPEAVWYQGALGDYVMGWLFKPAGFVEGNKYPLMLYVHGGPEGAWDDEWSTRWNPQTVTNQGYAVFAPNIHGSTGYGQNFTEAIRHNWGSAPFDDLMIGVPELLKKYSFLDGDSIYEMGASYGGYMGLWLQGHAPAGMFKAMLVHDGLFDLSSFWAATDELFFPEAEFGGPYYQNMDEYQKWSPSNYIDDWKFPMMIVHGGHDYRIPVSQGIGAFQALQRKGIDSQFLHFPLASHFVLRPPDSIMWHSEIFEWFAKHK